MEQTYPAMQRTTARAIEKLPPPQTAHLELERLAMLQAQSPATRSETRRSPKIGNAFGATSWYVPPPPQPKPPAPQPSAPPLPFTYLGKYEDGATRLIILVKGDRMYTVAEGDVIEDTYRVERVMASRVELTYLPLETPQFLATGEAL